MRTIRAYASRVNQPIDCFYYLITRASLVATAVLKKELATTAAAKIRPSFMGVLLALWGEDGLRSVDLGRRAGLEPSSMTRILDRMERDELIRREADPNDRRAQRIFLTDEGRKVEQPVRAVVDRMLGKIAKGVPTEELERTKDTLRKLLQMAQQERR